MRQHAIDIFWSDEDECYIATIKGYQLLSAHGETITEAAREIESAIDAMAKMGVTLDQATE